MDTGAHTHTRTSIFKIQINMHTKYKKIIFKSKKQKHVCVKIFTVEQQTYRNMRNSTVQP